MIDFISIRSTGTSLIGFEVGDLFHSPKVMQREVFCFELVSHRLHDEAHRPHHA